MAAVRIKTYVYARAQFTCNEEGKRDYVGNSVRLTDAVACYKACNGRHQSRVETVLRAWYDVWDRAVNQRHKEQYYSMRLKCLARINGKALEQYEVVKPVFTLGKY